MSMKKWQKLASEKAEVEQQNDKILAVIKNTKINKGFGQLSGEDLFKPITSRLDKLQVGDSNTKEEKEEVPDYGMDEFDLNNPFDGDFNPDAETPPPTPSPTPPPSPSSPTSSPPLSPTSTPLPPLAEEEETELMEEEQPSTSGVKPQPSKWGPPQELVIKGSESTDLQTLNSMLTKNKNNPNYVVKSKTSKFHNYTLADIKKARDEILERRKKGIKIPQRYFESMEPSDEEMEGSGSVDPNALVERLYLSLASIQAGNTSLKLKKQVQQMLGLLVKLKEITQKEAHKILGSII